MQLDSRLEPHHTCEVSPEFCVRKAVAAPSLSCHQGKSCRLASRPSLPLTALPPPPTAHSLRVTRWNLSGGTHLAGWPASAAASLSISLRMRRKGSWRSCGFVSTNACPADCPPNPSATRLEA